MSPKRVGIIGFDQVKALQLFGPADAFSAAVLDDGYGGRIPCYEVCTIGTTASFRTDSGFTVAADSTLEDAPDLDIIVIAGGKGIRTGNVSDRIADFLLERAWTSRIAAACSGIYGLAPTGFLDRREATTHWRFASDVARRFPAIRLDHRRPLVSDGRFFTAAGLSAGINLAVALIEEDYGRYVARSVSEELSIYRAEADREESRDGSQQQSTERFADLVAWIVRNLNTDLSLEVLARRACMSPDHFGKAFKSFFGTPPAEFIENLRLNEARRRLSKRQKTLQSVATSVGFRNSDAFQRAFQRKFGTRPSRLFAETNQLAPAAR